MRYIFDYLDKIKERMKGNRVFLFLDFDGTLAPIADTPDKASLPPETKKILGMLAKKKGFRVALVSGRDLAGLKEKVGLSGLIYSGNHGFQVEGPGLKNELSLPEGYRKILQAVKVRLKESLCGVKGVFIEDKGFFLALHFRLADSADLALIRKSFAASVAGPVKAHKVNIRAGKKVLEVGPGTSWDKGRIVLWLLSGQRLERGRGGVLPVYIGDDSTDEDAFRVLRKKGLTVCVGKAAGSLAGYYLKDTRETSRFLRFMLDPESVQSCRNR
jgi:trehalose-phosphatase